MYFYTVWDLWGRFSIHASEGVFEGESDLKDLCVKHFDLLA